MEIWRTLLGSACVCPGEKVRLRLTVFEHLVISQPAPGDSYARQMQYPTYRLLDLLSVLDVNEAWSSETTTALAETDTVPLAIAVAGQKLSVV